MSEETPEIQASQAQEPADMEADAQTSAPVVDPSAEETKTVEQIEDEVLASMKKPPAPKPETPAPEKPPSAVSNHLAQLKTPEDRANYFRAVRNLQWSGLGQKIIDGMGVDAVLEAGKNVGERRSALDRQRAQQQAKADSRQPKQGPTPENRPGRSAAPRKPDPMADQDEDEPPLDDESDPLDELLDDEQPEPPVTPKKQRREPDPFQEKHSRAIQERNAARMQLAFRSVEADFPLIKDEGHARKIADRMTELDSDRSCLEEGGEALETLIRHACLIEFGPVIQSQARAAQREAAEAIRNGQPFNASNRNTPVKPPTEEEYEDAALAALRETRGNLEEARSKLGQRFGA